MNSKLPADYLQSFIKDLCNEGIKFIIAGGVAGVLNGIERVTMDLDLALELSPENVKKFSGLMKRLGLIPLVPVATEELANPSVVKKMVDEKHAVVFMLADPDFPLRKVDVFLTDNLSYVSLFKSSETLNFDGVEFRVVTLEKLLELKRAVQPPRDKDLWDIQAIEKLLTRRNQGKLE